MLERKRHQTFQQTLSPEEVQQFHTAFSDFTGRTAHLEFSGRGNTFRLYEKRVGVTPLTFQLRRNRWNNPVMRHAISHLDSHEQKHLHDFATSEGKLYAFTNREHSDALTQQIRIHAKQQHFGSLSSTEFDLVQTNHERNTANTHTHKAHYQPILDVLDTSAPSVKLYALTDDIQVTQIVSKVNDALKPFHERYAIGLSIDELANRSSKASRAMILKGVVAEPLLEITKRFVGDSTSRILSQCLGEVLTQQAVSADTRHSRREQRIATRKKLSEYVQALRTTHFSTHEIISHAKARMRHVKDAPSLALEHTKRKLTDIKNASADTKKIYALRIGALATTMAMAISLSLASQWSGSLIPYSFVPGINTSLLTFFEFLSRRIEYATHDHPYQIAYHDMMRNPYTIGMLSASLLTSLLTVPLHNAGFPDAANYALSGIIGEPTGALIAKGIYDTLHVSYRRSQRHYLSQ